MGLFSFVKRVGKPLVNVPKWMDYETLKTNTSYVVNVAKNLFIPRSGTRRDESFDAALARLNLTEAALATQKRGLLRNALVSLAIAIVIVLYSFYHLFHGTWVTFFASMGLAAVMFSIAFRNHFWYTQIQQRRLGLTFQEWYESLTKGSAK